MMLIDRRQALSSIGAFLSLSTHSLAGIAAGRKPSPKTCADFLAWVQAGDADKVSGMLSQDASLARSKDPQGRSAFSLAHVHGHPKVAKLLSDTGLELDLVESILAEDWPRFDGLAKKHEGELNRAHAIGGTPMYAAALVGSLDFWRLRSVGCLPDQVPVGGSGLTAFRAAVDSVNPNWARISMCDLGGNGSSINAPQRAGNSVLHACVERKDAMLVRLAIRKGADVAARDEAGRTPLALAEQIGWKAGLSLLQAEASLPRDNRSSRFALDANREPIQRPDLSDVPQALQSQVTSNSHGRLAKVKELVAKDKRLIFSISTDEELAIEASAHLGNRPLMRFHLDQGAPLSLPTAVSLGDLSTTRFLLEKDSDLANERGAHDFPVMWFSLLGGASVEMAEELVLRGVPVDQESMGTTTLHWCVRRNALELAAFLLKSGCDPQPLGFKGSPDLSGGHEGASVGFPAPQRGASEWRG